MLKELGQADGPGGGGAQLSRDRSAWITGGLLIGVAALAWVAVVRQAMTMAGEAMPATDAGMSTGGAMSPGEPAPYLIAWGVMMAAMMLPSSAPMIALYGALRRNFTRSGQTGIPTVLFASVYMLVWIAVGAPVYLASAAVAWAAGMVPAVAGAWPYALAAVLLAAGLYQFSPLKRACLRVCQSPVGFLMGHWRGGYRGTLRMAWDHAAYCVGCCWGLMVVLVAAGAMSLPWVLLIAVVVFAEKLFPRGQWLARVVGGALIALSVLVAVRPETAALLRGPGM